MSGGHRYEPSSRARRRALQALYAWHLNAQDADAIIAQFFDEQDFGNVDVHLFEALVRGVVSDHEKLDDRLSEFLDRPGGQLDVMERVVLHMGAWELINRPETPFQVILDEAVELARRFGSEQGHGFVNGVLDRAAKSWRPDGETTPGG
ncbi:MAG: transcription antitermination factor NusB [Xanthomonadales bacterium]|nr:transcription antitermination factor NusB [Xanthomonadales bacterium]NIX13255.1 transcription antitermination factor NusB [Xanthomonadales bacterium]